MTNAQTTHAFSLTTCKKKKKKGKLLTYIGHKAINGESNVRVCINHEPLFPLSSPRLINKPIAKNFNDPIFSSKYLQYIITRTCLRL